MNLHSDREYSGFFQSFTGVILCGLPHSGGKSRGGYPQVAAGVYLTVWCKGLKQKIKDYNVWYYGILIVKERVRKIKWQ